MKINILTHNNHFGCGIDSSLSLNLNLLCKAVNAYGLKTEVIEYSELLEVGVNSDELYWVASHQSPTIRAYIEDIVIGLFQGELSENLIVNIDLIRAYENKGYQVIMANKYDLPMPKQKYLTEFNLQYIYFGNTEVVIKRMGGSSSSGVIKIKAVNQGKDLQHFLKKTHRNFIPLNEWLYFVKEKIRNVLNKPYAKKRLEQYRPTTRLVSQEFLEGLTFDYRVLVFFNKCFVSKRYTQKGDFRASGSGIYEFIEDVPVGLLDFAFAFRESVTAPYVSLDIVQYQSDFKVIEFQCVHLGPYTKIYAPSVFIKEAERWVKRENCKSLEEEYAESIVGFIKKENLK
jgi:glutathione synthase/RimK-type ligase-like ATP-grasp enzyme